MLIDLKNLVHVTRDSKRSLSDLLPIYRQAILNEDCKVREFAVDSMLMRAAISDAGEWAAFEKHLQTGYEYIRSVSWLGHFLGPMRTSEEAPDPADHDKRRQTVLWLIEHYPDTRIHQRVEAALNDCGDEAAYDIGTSLWLKKMLESPDNVNILSNASHFCASRRPLLSRSFLSACVKLEPNIDKWQRRLAALDQAGKGDASN